MRIKGTEALFRRILTTKDVFEAFFSLVLLVSRFSSVLRCFVASDSFVEFPIEFTRQTYSGD